METLLTAVQSVREETGPPTRRQRVCIHMLREARADFRLLRSARALAEAGFAVSVVDVEAKAGCPRRETLQDVRLEHVLVPQWYQARQMELWFLLVAVQTFVRSLLLLLRISLLACIKGYFGTIS